jgi:hypothetical protein
MNGWHEPSTHLRQLPQYEGSGLILIALVGLFLFTGAKIGWGLATLVFLGPWLVLLILPVLVCLILRVVLCLLLIPCVFIGLIRSRRRL